ncbi:MAG: hypothetical protein ABH829_05645 [archaeon]
MAKISRCKDCGLPMDSWWTLKTIQESEKKGVCKMCRRREKEGKDTGTPIPLPK